MYGYILSPGSESARWRDDEFPPQRIKKSYLVYEGCTAVRDDAMNRFALVRLELGSELEPGGT